jgi:uncharacterized protein YpmS
MAEMTRRAGRGGAVFLAIVLVAIVLGAMVGVLWGHMPSSQSRAAGPGSARTATGKATPPGPNRLVLSEAQLTDMLRQAAGSNAPDARVTLEPGRLVVTGTVKKGLLGLPLHAAIEPFVEDGTLSVRVQEAKVGGMPLPQEATMALAGRVRHVLYQEQQKIKGLALDTVEIKDKQLVLTGHFEAGTTAGTRHPVPNSRLATRGSRLLQGGPHGNATTG